MKTKIKQTLRKMSKPQKNYAIKKAKRDSIKEEVVKATKPINEEIDQLDIKENKEKINKLIDKTIEIEYKLGLHKAIERERKAEKRLVNWFFSKIEGKKDFKELEDLEEVKRNWNKYPQIRDKIVDLAFHYNPNK